MSRRRYTIAAEWGDVAEADTRAQADLAVATIASDHRPHDPGDTSGITVAMFGGPNTPAEYRDEARDASEPLRTWLLDRVDQLETGRP